MSSAHSRRIVPVVRSARFKPPRTSPLLFSLALLIPGISAAEGGGEAGGGFFDFSQPGSAGWNGVAGGKQIDGGQGMTALQAMLWRYTARCALEQGQHLEAPDAATGKRLRFPGMFGVAPEWRHGTCDKACQEKVSSCLIALTNRTGKHVLVSVLSGSPSMSKKLLPDDNDRDFPHQEGAFFGNVFSNEAYACQGQHVGKAPQVKRYCAREPASCSGLSTFTDVGPCQKACEMKCVRLSDGSERCAASSCKDPAGRLWAHPVTTYLRNRIEAANADETTGIRVEDEGLSGLGVGDSAVFKDVDFGASPRATRTFVAHMAGGHGKGRVEIWVDGQTRIGVLTLGGSRPAKGEHTTAIDTHGISAAHQLTLQFVAGKQLGRLTAIELR